MSGLTNEDLATLIPKLVKVGLTEREAKQLSLEYPLVAKALAGILRRTPVMGEDNE